MDEITTDEIKQLIDKISEDDWTNFSKQLYKYETRLPSKKCVKYLITEIKGHSTPQAFYNYSILSLSITKSNLISSQKYIDLFQPSQFKKDSMSIYIGFVENLIQHFDYFGIEENSKKLFVSILDYAKCYKIYNQEVSSLEKEIIKNKTWLIGTGYTLIEEYFLKTRDLKSTKMTKENMATGLSFLINISGNVISIEDNEFQIDRKKCKEVENILINCVKLSDFREIEPSIFRLGYFFKKCNDKKYIWEPPSEIYEKSLRSGYMKNTMNIMNTVHSNDDKTQSLYKMAEYFYENFPDVIFHVIEDNKFKRLCMGFRMEEKNVKELLEGFAETLQIGKNTIFLEEKNEIDHLCKDLFVSDTELLELKITDKLSLFEFLEIHRINTFFSLVREMNLLDLHKNDNGVYENSIIGVSPLDFQEQLNEWMGIPRTKTQEYFKIYSWSYSAAEITKDIQYHPIILLKDKRVLYPFSLISKSNIFRNTLVSQRIRPNDDGQIDRMSIYLREFFLKISTYSESDISFSFLNLKGQVDYAVLIDDTIFIFECKNSLFPTNNFERRTLDDYLRKAAKQLSIQIDLLQNPDYVRYLFKKLNWPIPQNLKVKTCIALGTRLFTGSDYESHPVRYIHEITQYIDSGKASVNVLFKKEERKIIKKYWKNDNFEKCDLVDFLSSKCKFYTDHFDSQYPSEQKIHIGDVTIHYNDYPLKTLDYSELLSKG